MSMDLQMTIEIRTGMGIAGIRGKSAGMGIVVAYEYHGKMHIA